MMVHDDREIILEMTDIDKAFPGVQALDKAQFTLRKGTVHALMGENGAGKSTLMKCLYGIYFRDSGRVVLDGEEVNFTCPKEALDNGIGMIHQELQPIPQMTIAENIFLGDYPMKGIFVDHETMNDQAAHYLSDIGLKVDPQKLLGELTISQQQAVEIAKAISRQTKVIIMDEPTSSLTDNEVENLFKVIDRLRQQGIAIIYISHKMDEIKRIADEITIMRDGKYVGTYNAKEISVKELIHHMVGRKLTNIYPPYEANYSDEVVLKINNFTSPRNHSFKECSFELKKGEVLGIAGLVGAQRSELMEAIYGLRDVAPGASIHINGEAAQIHRPKDANRNGIALVTEDRRHSGIFGVLSVTDNTALPSLRDYLSAFGLIQERSVNQMVDQGIETLNVKTPSRHTLIQNLSGGNQQKVILARWLATDPEIFILDEPTRGIDVGAKYEIYEIINELSRRGKSIILISSEMGEIIGMSDRIMVMCDGRISGFLDREQASQESILELATAFMTN